MDVWSWLSPPRRRQGLLPPRLWLPLLLLARFCFALLQGKPRGAGGPRLPQQGKCLQPFNAGDLPGACWVWEKKEPLAPPGASACSMEPGTALGWKGP